MNCACGLCPSSSLCLTCGLTGCDCPPLPAPELVDLLALVERVDCIDLPVDRPGVVASFPLYDGGGRIVGTAWACSCGAC